MLLYCIAVITVVAAVIPATYVPTGVKAISAVTRTSSDAVPANDAAATTKNILNTTVAVARVSVTAAVAVTCTDRSECQQVVEAG